MTTSAPVTVVVPVFRGLDEVRACIESTLRHGAKQAFRLVIIDDDSPEPEVKRFLDALESRDTASTHGCLGITVIRNDQNHGFVASVNRGLEHAPGHAVILNADTVVTRGWLDQLHDAATTLDDVATVTPLSNFGSICTLPSAVIDAFALQSEEPRIDECAEFVREFGLGYRPEVISGVGFCMFMTRQALDECGGFDQRTFGRGYGEEVDFCLRATRMGFRNLVEDRTFVYHHGAVSFGADREEGLQRGSALIRTMYPFFRSTNRRERDEEPLAPTFAALELALRPRREDRPHVLHVLHSAPNALGGTEKHLDALITSLLPEIDFAVFHPVESGFVVHTYWLQPDDTVAEHEFLLPGGARRATRVLDENAGFALRTALDLFDFDAVHIQNLIGHSLAPLAALADFSGPVVYSFRDPFLACPSHALLYMDKEFCGIPDDLSLCANCLPVTRQQDLRYLKDFRATADRHIDAVDTWVFASQSAADLLLRVYDIEEDRLQLIPHGAIVDLDNRCSSVDRALVYDEPLRVAFVGLGRAKKGLEVVNWLADQLADTTIEIHHFGNLIDLASGNLQLHGPYDNMVLPQLLHDAGIHAVLLPGHVSETFGHVMTESLVAGIPVIGTYYGALGERIRASGAGWTIDPTEPGEILELLLRLDACRAEVERGMRAAIATELRSVGDTADQYRALYVGVGDR